MEIYTSYYAKKLPEHITRIGISVGHPKWEPDMLKLLEFAPAIDMLSLRGQEEAYRVRYFAILDYLGIDCILHLLDEATLDGTRPIALLCYEALNKPNQFCHRTMLAEYINKHSSIIVSEYGVTPTV